MNYRKVYSDNGRHCQICGQAIIGGRVRCTHLQPIRERRYQITMIKAALLGGLGFLVVLLYVATLGLPWLGSASMTGLLVVALMVTGIALKETS